MPDAPYLCIDLLLKFLCFNFKNLLRYLKCFHVNNLLFELLKYECLQGKGTVLMVNKQDFAVSKSKNTPKSKISFLRNCSAVAGVRSRLSGNHISQYNL